MFRALSLVGVLGLALALAGCGKEEEKKLPAPPTQAPAKTGEGATAAVTKEAQALFDQVQQYLKDKKLDDADSALKKLEGMKANLPAEWASKIDSLRKTLDAAKAIKLPEGMPALPK